MLKTLDTDGWKQMAEEGFPALQDLIDSAEPGGIIVMQSAGLGDSLHVSVVIHQLRRNNPNRWIGWATGQAYLSLHHRNPHANKVVGLPKPPIAPGDPAGVAVRTTWLQYIRERRPDLLVVAPSWVIDYDAHQNGDMILGANDYASMFFKASGVNIDPDIRCPIVEIPPELQSWAKRWVHAHGKPLVGFSPLSFSQTITLERQIFIDFIDRLSQENLKVVYLGGPDEPRLDAIDARGLPFDRTAALLQELDVFVGCSSGNLSLALTNPTLPIVAVGTPYKAAPASCDYFNPCIEVATYEDAAEEVLRLFHSKNLEKSDMRNYG